MNQRITRRGMLQGSAITAASIGLAGLSARSYGNVLGSNEDVRMGVIGFKSRGNTHIDAWTKIKGVRLVALCDADKDVIKAGLARAEKAYGGGSEKPTTAPSNQPSKPKDKKKKKGGESASADVRLIADDGDNPDAGNAPSAVNIPSRPMPKIETYTDLRRMFDNKDVDAVSTATPNHWHALVTIWGVQAGKDVYVEKPVSHNVSEGRRMVEAARKYNKIVQTGTQNRSRPGLTAAYKWMWEGNLGKVKIARGLCYKRRGTIGLTEGPQKVPSTVDYNLWLGPAAMEQPRRKQFHYDWHWFWNYGGGDLANQGIHEMDKARWALQKGIAPKTFSIGGRFGYKDDAETPNTMFVVHDYGEQMVIFEVRGLPRADGDGLMDKYRTQSVGDVIECEGGYLADTTAYDNDGKKIKEFPDDGLKGVGHFENFIAAVRSRDMKDLNADIEQGHRSSAMCHTGNISYRLGETAKSRDIREALSKNKAAMETYERFRNHLEDNEVSLVSENAVLGAFLEFDPETERFTNNDKANELLTRNYRAPFVVPTSV